MIRKGSNIGAAVFETTRFKLKRKATSIHLQIAGEAETCYECAVPCAPARAACMALQFF